jgi:protein subunit release factor B
MYEPKRRVDKGERVLSVTLDDCDVQTFRVGGNGGQKVNKTSSGVRIIHRESGARGESREDRSQHRNKRIAFERMVATSTFQTWMKRKLGQDALDEAELKRRLENQLQRDMRPENIKVETFEHGKWVGTS